MVELNILTGHRVHATSVVREEAGSMLVVPAEDCRTRLGLYRYSVISPIRRYPVARGQNTSSTAWIVIATLMNGTVTPCLTDKLLVTGKIAERGVNDARSARPRGLEK